MRMPNVIIDLVTMTRIIGRQGSIHQEQEQRAHALCDKEHNTDTEMEKQFRGNVFNYPDRSMSRASPKQRTDIFRQG